jgi:hypothetical protein
MGRFGRALASPAVASPTAARRTAARHGWLSCAGCSSAGFQTPYRHNHQHGVMQEHARGLQTGRTTVGASHRPVVGPDDAGRIAAFQHDLRTLRERAGSPSLRRMAVTAHYSHTALAGVLTPGRLPSLPLTLAYVRACGGDENHWGQRWSIISRRAAAPPSVATRPPDPPRWKYLAVVGTAVVLAAAFVVGHRRRSSRN